MRNHITRNRVLAAFVVLILLAGGITALMLSHDSNKDPASAKSKTDADKALIARLKQAAQDPDPCASYFSKNELTKAGNVLPALPRESYRASVAKGDRHTADSLDTRLLGASDKDKFNNLAKAICSRPYVGGSFGVLLRNYVKIGDKTIGDFLPNFGPAASAPKVKAAVKKAYASATGWETYQKQAAQVVSVLNLANVVGVQNHRMSQVNIHFANLGLPDSKGFPSVAVNRHQENLPALVLEFREKGVACPVAAIGANTLDKRPELFGTSCGHKPPVTPCKHNCGSQPPTCSHNCGHKPKCVPPSILLPQGVCSHGKYASEAPSPTGGPVKQCPGGYLSRDGVCHKGTYTPPPGGGGSGGDSGHGDSGPGATNTTSPPATSAPEDPLPTTTAPTVTPPPKP